VLERDRVFWYNRHEVKMMARDRGTMKWASLMLPEHVKLLQHVWEEDIKVKKPEVDQQTLALMNDEFMMAYEQNEQIELTMYDGGHIERRIGVIMGVNAERQDMYLRTTNGNRETISFMNIITLTIK